MPTSARSIGVLVTGADWAIAHGDVEALAYVTAELSMQVSGPLRGALSEISELCRQDPDRACARWNRLRSQIVAPDEPPGTPVGRN